MNTSSDRIAVELRPYDPVWPELAQRESKRLAAVLGDSLVTIEHIGSTAIAGIYAKPIVDLLPIVHSLSAADSAAGAIQALGYTWRGEFGLPGRRYCTLNDPATGRRLFQVHMFENGSAEIDRLLTFRDYLRDHPDEALAYEREKQRAAALHPTDTLAYNDEKSAWIKACESRAVVWRAAATNS